MAGTFTLTINSYDSTQSTFGETRLSERLELVYLIRKAAQQIGSGLPSAVLVDQGYLNVGSYVYGVGMINAGA